MPSRAEESAVAVTSTTVSPNRTSAAPPACLAMRPVSTESVRPWNSISTFWKPPGCDMSLSPPRHIRPHRLGEFWRGGREEKRKELLPDAEALDHTLVALKIAALQVV